MSHVATNPPRLLPLPILPLLLLSALLVHPWPSAATPSSRTLIPTSTSAATLAQGYDTTANSDSDSDSKTDTTTNSDSDSATDSRSNSDSIDDLSKIPNWWTPFQRRNIIDPLAHPECRGIAPGFDPGVLKIRDSIPPIKSLEDLRVLKRGQKVVVIAPRFGLGNTLRNWVSAFYWGLFSGRRIVLLHGGKFHGVYASLCAAFDCAFDHIYGDNETHSQALLGDFHRGFEAPVRALGMSVAHRALYWDDPVVFAFNYAFWDHWWTNNRTLGRCGCAAVGGCRGGGGHRSVAVNALISGGPTDALNSTLTSILAVHPVNASALLLPLGPRLATQLQNFGAGTSVALEAEFDIGLHIRTRVGILERPHRPFGGCRGAACQRMQEEEQEMLRGRFLKPQIWACLDAFLMRFSELRSPGGAPQALSIFLATDNVILRDEFARRLAPYGALFYNRGQVAHVGTSGMRHAGRLPTVAEFFLLGKSTVVVEQASYLSTFAQFAALLGNGTLVGLGSDGANPGNCAGKQAAQIGVWRKGDPRAYANQYFKIEK